MLKMTGLEIKRALLLCTVFLVVIVCVQANAHSGSSHHVPAHAPVLNELGSTVAVDEKDVLWALTKQEVKEGEAALVLRHSQDTGKTWSAPVIVTREKVTARGDERPMLAFGPRGEFYILYTSPSGRGGNPHIGDIRFVRSLDGGRTFSEPVTVHANRDAIVHAFGSMIVDRKGTLYVAWIDSRNKETAKAQQQAYAGNGLYYAVSTDGGKTFQGDYRVADHSCECCRLALTLDEQQRAFVMWRHIFLPDIRDHAVAMLGRDGTAGAVQRATTDDWRINACPHQGPSMAIAEDGTRHQAWFSMKQEEGGIYYASVNRNGKSSPPLRLGGAQASHADVGVHGSHIAVAWKEWDGKSTVLKVRLSQDKGRNWKVKELARTQGLSARPQLLLLSSGLAVAWHTEGGGMRILPLGDEW